MDAAAGVLDPELRPPPPPPPEPPSGMDDSQFLGSMMGDTVLAQPAPTQQLAPATAPGPAPAHHQQQVVVVPAPTPKKRGRPPRSANGAAAVGAATAVLTPAAARRAEAKAAKKCKEEEEDEVVCFICFDGGDLVVCDRRGCPKVYHPSCIKRDESFFTSRTKWNCGTPKVSEKYNIGKKMTNFALEILNLTKKEIITMDTISNQDFTQEECKRLRQSMKYGLIDRLKVGDIQDKATVFQSVRVNDWLENEKQRLGYLRDRASETGRRKEYPIEPQSGYKFLLLHHLPFLVHVFFVDSR